MSPGLTYILTSAKTALKTTESGPMVEGGVSEFAQGRVVRTIYTVWGSVFGWEARLFERPCRSGCVRSSSLRVGKDGPTRSSVAIQIQI